jgi:paraquat-inducible protein A
MTRIRTRRDVKSYPRLVCCEHCDSLFLRERLAPHETAACTRCETPLYRHHGFSMQALVAMALASGLLFVTANAAPLFTVDLRGVTREVRLWDAVAAFAGGPTVWVAPLAAWCFIVVPLTQVVLLNWVFAWAARRVRAPGFAGAMRVLHALRPWSMCEVSLLGALVAGIKLTGYLDVMPQVGLLALALLTIVLLVLGHRDINVLWDVTRPRGPPREWPARRAPSRGGFARLDAQAVLAGAGPGVPRAVDLRLEACHACGLVCGPVHRAADATDAGTIGAPPACPRCHASLHPRKPAARALAWALLVAGAVMYVPANLLPVMTTQSFGAAQGSTILAGVLEFYTSGHHDIAVIIFVASVLVPCTKFLVLGFLLLGLGRPTPTGRRERTRMLRMLEFVGYWSMLDVIVVGLVVAAVQFGAVMSADAGEGIVSFAASVALTMLAAMRFDGRAIWDAPRGTAASPAATPGDPDGPAAGLEPRAST